MEAAEAAEGEDDGSELGGGAAQLGGVAGADELPEALVEGGALPELADAGGGGEGAGVGVFQDLVEEVVVHVGESGCAVVALFLVLDLSGC